jgi:hypothetical protein
MPSLLKHRSLACAATALLLCACQNVPKYKHGNGNFNEWATYESGNFKPAHGNVIAVDAAAHSITIGKGKETRVFAVTPSTRIIHETTDITLAQLPVGEAVRFTVSEDGTRLMSVWYGQQLNAYHRPVAAKPKNSLY